MRPSLGFHGCRARAAAAAFACTLLSTGAAAAAGTTADAQGGSANQAPERHGSVYLDPLGLLLFGPTMGVEGGLGHVTGLVSARWLNMGLLAHSLFLNQGDSFDFSWGVGAGGRYYLWTGMTGPYAGARFEYIATRVENAASLVVTSSGYAVPQIEGGYRLPFGNMFYAGATAAVGYAFKVSGSVDNLPGGMNASLYTSADRSSVYGTASLELGVLF